MDSRGNSKTSDQQISAAVIYELIDGFTRTQIISVAAELGIADLLMEGPKDIYELATSADAHPRALQRILRALASLGIFAEREDGRFELTSLAEPLQSGVPGSMRDFAIMYGQEWYWKPWGNLLDSVRTGESAFEHVHGKDLFGYLGEDEQAASVFNGAMTSITGEGVNPILESYDFSDFAKIVDVGGGHGTLIVAVLKAHPQMRGMLFDLPSVAEGAKVIIQEAGVADRCEMAGGDFFESVPVGGDVYVLKFVIHDWDDDRTIAILRNCRKAITRDGKLLLVERGIVPHSNEPAPIKFMDLHMLVITGGIERTEAEIGALFEAAGFKLTKVIPTGSPDNVIVEGIPV